MRERWEKLLEKGTSTLTDSYLQPVFPIHAGDDNLLINATVFADEKIVKAVKATGAIVSGPIPLPTEKDKFTVLRSPHVNKKSREQFQLCTYKRLVDIYSTSSKTVDALMKLELPSGVDVEIKV